jgi:hypothetical protein
MRSEDPFEQEAREAAKAAQDEADAEADCYQRQRTAADEGNPVACLDCSSCESGKALLQELDEMRARAEERSSADTPEELARDRRMLGTLRATIQEVHDPTRSCKTDPCGGDCEGCNAATEFFQEEEDADDRHRRDRDSAEIDHDDPINQR